MKGSCCSRPGLQFCSFTRLPRRVQEENQPQSTPLILLHYSLCVFVPILILYTIHNHHKGYYHFFSASPMAAAAATTTTDGRVVVVAVVVVMVGDTRRDETSCRSYFVGGPSSPRDSGPATGSCWVHITRSIDTYFFRGNGLFGWFSPNLLLV